MIASLFSKINAIKEFIFLLCSSGIKNDESLSNKVTGKILFNLQKNL